jgi:hypothetical protein
LTAFLHEWEALLAVVEAQISRCGSLLEDLFDAPAAPKVPSLV